MAWFFGYAEVNGETQVTEPRELECAEQADEIGAWPGLFTSAPYDSEREARERIAEILAD